MSWWLILMLKLCYKHNDHNNNYKKDTRIFDNIFKPQSHEFNTESEAGTTDSDSLSRYFRCVNLFINELCNNTHKKRKNKNKNGMHVWQPLQYEYIMNKKKWTKKIEIKLRVIWIKLWYTSEMWTNMNRKNRTWTYFNNDVSSMSNFNVFKQNIGARMYFE